MGSLIILWGLWGLDGSWLFLGILVPNLRLGGSSEIPIPLMSPNGISLDSSRGSFERISEKSRFGLGVVDERIGLDRSKRWLEGLGSSLGVSWVKTMAGAILGGSWGVLETTGREICRSEGKILGVVDWGLGTSDLGSNVSCFDSSDGLSVVSNWNFVEVSSGAITFSMICCGSSVISTICDI